MGHLGHFIGVVCGHERSHDSRHGADWCFRRSAQAGKLHDPEFSGSIFVDGTGGLDWGANIGQR